MKWCRIYHSYSQQTKGPRGPALIPQRHILVFLSFLFKLFWNYVNLSSALEHIFMLLYTRSSFLFHMYPRRFSWINGYWELTESISSVYHFTAHSSLEHHPSSQWKSYETRVLFDHPCKSFLCSTYKKRWIYKKYIMISF